MTPLEKILCVLIVMFIVTAIVIPFIPDYLLTLT